MHCASFYGSVFITAALLVSALSSSTVASCTEDDATASCVDRSHSTMAVPIRRITRVFTATRQREGAGFIVAQPVPHARLRESESDPFLMLHAFGPVMVDHRSPGAPWHPHRGFDTVTYLLQGESQHQDSMGNKGTIKGGEVQWMRAGSGIIHDEGSNGMTRDDPPRPSEGFQIWVNLPSHLKMSPPDYRQLTAETFKWVDYTQFDSTGTKVKLIAGDFQAADGSAPVLTSPLNDALAIPVVIADVRLVPGGRAKIAIDPSFETLIVYVFQGSARLFNGDVDATGTVLKRDDCALLSEEPGILYLAALEAPEYAAAVVEDPKTSKDLDANAVGLHGASILILAGRKIREPVARHGPFVMNTAAELQQAFEDYHNGKLATVKGAETKY